MEETQVILVDENDQPLGYMGKMEAHEKGLLHRAFSIFIFNARGEMLLQQRAMNKYHSSCLWTNACCSHPIPGEDLLVSAQRRLQEEMGFSTSLEKIFDFTYHANLDNGLSEFEFDHVFAGEYDGAVNFNEKEVMDFCYKDMAEISQSIQDHPRIFSSWFQLAFPAVRDWWASRYKNKVPDVKG